MGNKLIAVVGPTGSGKTTLAAGLAKQFNGIIISADSRQVYQQLNVGTNKEGALGSWHNIPARTINKTIQLMVDVATLGQAYSLANWLQEVERLLPIIWANHQLPIITGGTGLYVSALTDGYILGRGRYSTTRKPVTFQSLVLETDVSREELYARSDQRCQEIFNPLVKEVSDLLAIGVSADWLSRLGLDYRYATLFVTQQISQETALAGLQKASRAYIRRQQTWWRHHGSPIQVSSLATAQQQVKKFLNN